MTKLRRILTTALWVVLLITVLYGIYLNWVGLKTVISQGWKAWFTSEWLAQWFISIAVTIISAIALALVIKKQEDTHKA